MAVQRSKIAIVTALTVSSAAGVYLMMSPSSAVCEPSDGLDDTECVQEMIDAACDDGGGKVHLGAGEWIVTREPPAPGSRDNASWWLDCSNLSLEGDGPGVTTVMMTGDSYNADWAGIRIAAGIGPTPDAGAPRVGIPTAHVSVSGMTIASDHMTNPSEQTHLLMLGSTTTDPGTISDVGIHHVNFRHPVVPEVAGDCLRFVGEAAYPISVVDVGDVVFEACDRSGWALQRGAESIKFHNAQFRNIGKTAVDMEPSGQGPIRIVEMDNLETHESGISIAGSGGGGGPTVWTSGVSLSNSHVGGRLGVTYVSGLDITGTMIEEVAAGSEGSLHIRGSKGVRMTGGSVRRLLGSVAGPAVKLVGTSGTYSNNVTITGAHIYTEIAGDVVSLESAQDVTLNGNWIAGIDASGAAIFAKALGQDLDRLQIEGNRIKGPFQYAIKIAGSPLNVGVVQVNGNQSSGAAPTGTAGLRCENPAKFLKPVVHGGGYYYDGAAAATSGCTGTATPVAQRP